ncbi:A24 family peptidase [Pedomonas mirosovicensis]|uniref:A24 family peptidase n=1 Tax=Pedomonas mirosovicensis TaxID=2908641 RepID=UPI002169615D|nr:prepilin peptidase [Pedomonas mirosovicensis]MCH8685433.1 prepilin peptidase [Pedomonas mirosovicensis]
MWDIIRLSLLLTLVALLVIAAVGDVRRYRISNRLCIAVAGLALPYWLAASAATGAALLPLLGWQIGVALLVFIGFAVLFALGAMGGGDVKLVAALALWIPPARILELIFLIAIYGGVLALVLVVTRRLRGQTHRAVPYGVAIALGGITLALEPIVNFSGL